MIKDILKYVSLFVLFVLLQVLVLNNIQFSGMVNPFLYILLILLLPMELSTVSLMIIGLILGLSVDVFSNTPGIHASATVFAAYIRPFVLSLLSSGRDEYEVGKPPRIYTYGFGWFIRYSTVIVIAHHLFLFMVETFSISGIGYALVRSLASSLFTLVLIILLQFLFIRNQAR